LYQYYTIVVLTVSVTRRRDVIDRCPHVRPQAFILALPRFASLLLLLITSRQFASTDTPIVGGQEIQDAAAKLEKRLKSSLGTILGAVDGKGAEEDEDGQDDDGVKAIEGMRVTDRGSWLRGKDLNLRPLGYEFARRW
jgi:hypothetical protein